MDEDGDLVEEVAPGMYSNDNNNNNNHYHHNDNNNNNDTNKTNINHTQP